MATKKSAQPDPVDPEESSADAEEQPVEPVTMFLAYVGAANSRTIRADDWRHMGFDQSDTIWDDSNNKRIPLEELDPGVVEYLKNDSEFRIIGSNQYF